MESLIMSQKGKYIEQFERVKRWYGRMIKINQGLQHNLPSDNYQDEVYAFFLNCYHLKDWIKNDKSSGTLAEKVEKFVETNNELCICADICNANKHLRIDHTKSDQNPRFGKRKFNIELGDSKPIISVKYSIDTLSGTIDAFELAGKCLKAWEKYISMYINDK